MGMSGDARLSGGELEVDVIMRSSLDGDDGFLIYVSGSSRGLTEIMSPRGVGNGS